MKMAPYVSTVKDFFHLPTILRYVAIPANEGYYDAMVDVCRKRCAAISLVGLHTQSHK
jgi:hypothetical protein